MSWEWDAACKGRPVELFYPDGPVKGRKDLLRRVIGTFCVTCPVRPDCFAAGRAQAFVNRWGVWGGVYYGDNSAPFDPFGYLPATTEGQR